MLSELRLGVAERCAACCESRRVVGQQHEQPADAVTIDAVAQVEGDEHRVRLRWRLDAGLACPEERDA